MFVPAVVTVHEFSRVHLLRKLAIIPFFCFAKRLIFTSDAELDAVASRMPWIRAKSTVIEIGSNIPVVAEPPSRTAGEIIYFGLIAPKKGIESVLELASLIVKKRQDISVRIIGATVPRLSDYANDLREQAKDLPVAFDTDCDDAETGAKLARASVAYLPFPNGASTSRGSLKAVLACGVATITTSGPRTSPALASTVLLASTPSEALDISLELLAQPERVKAISAASRQYSQSFAWGTIARDHVDVYSKVRADL
ncbi:MAG TPA: hypothetical protein VGD59_13645 [Acidisarcina sp.]